MNRDCVLRELKVAQDSQMWASQRICQLRQSEAHLATIRDPEQRKRFAMPHLQDAMAHAYAWQRQAGTMIWMCQLALRELDRC